MPAAQEMLAPQRSNTVQFSAITCTDQVQESSVIATPDSVTHRVCCQDVLRGNRGRGRMNGVQYTGEVGCPEWMDCGDCATGLVRRGHTPGLQKDGRRIGKANRCRGADVHQPLPGICLLPSTAVAKYDPCVNPAA